MKKTPNTSKGQLNMFHNTFSSTKSKLLLQTLKSSRRRSRCSSQVRAIPARKVRHFSPLLKEKRVMSRTDTKARKSMSPCNRASKEHIQKKKMNLSLDTFRTFCFNVLKFYELPTLPIEFYSELGFIKSFVSKAKISDPQIESIIFDLEQLAEPALPVSLREKLEEFSKPVKSPFLHSAEHKFQQEISKLTAKSLTSVANSPSNLLLSFLFILREVDSSIVVPRQTKTMRESLKKYFVSPGKILLMIKRLPEAIRTNKIGQKAVERSKKLLNKVETEDVFTDFMKEVFSIIRLYKLFYTKNLKSRSRCKSLSTEFKPSENNTNPRSTKAAILQQYLKGQCPNFVLNVSQCSENDYSSDYLLTSKSIASRPATSMSTRKPLKRSNFKF